MIARIQIHGGRQLLEGVMDFAAVQPAPGMTVWFDMFEATVTEVMFLPDGNNETPRTDVKVRMTVSGGFDSKDALKFLTDEPFAALTGLSLEAWCYQTCCPNYEDKER